MRAIEGGLLRLKWLAAATRFELALLRHERALKYRPDQPRVPAGNPDGGSGRAMAAADVVRPRDRPSRPPAAGETSRECYPTRHPIR